MTWLDVYGQISFLKPVTDALMLLMRWCCWCTDAANALLLSKILMLLMHCCCLAPCKSVTNYGPLTEPKFYIVKSGRTQIPTSNGHISETKRGILDPLVPKFFSRRGLSSTLSWKWANVTLSPSFGLFQSEKPLFRGVPDVTHCHSLARICPQVPFPRGKKKFTWPPILWQAV